MENIEFFFDLVEKSDIVVISHLVEDSHVMNELISKIPHIKINNVNSIKSYLRDQLIDYLLDEDPHPIKNVVLNLNDIVINPIGVSSYISVSSIVIKIREEMYNVTSHFPSRSKFKLILIDTAVSLLTLKKDFLINPFDFIGTSSMPAVEVCDLGVFINGDILKVFKNRYGDTETQISLDCLKNYDYICL